jgi:hypothetical protein
LAKPSSAACAKGDVLRRRGARDPGVVEVDLQRLADVAEHDAERRAGRDAREGVAAADELAQRRAERLADLVAGDDLRLRVHEHRLRVDGRRRDGRLPGRGIGGVGEGIAARAMVVPSSSVVVLETKLPEESTTAARLNQSSEPN